MTQRPLDVAIRRVAAEDGQRVRLLRLEAVGDPDAAIAFLTTVDDELAREDAFWLSRAAGAASGDDAAQFVAVDGDEWVGTATILRCQPGALDHLGRPVGSPRVDVVGVYLRPSERGRGILQRLLDAAADWALAQGIDELTLDVHSENVRAQAAYRKAGFAPTGHAFTSVIGPEIEMARRLSD